MPADVQIRFKADSENLKRDLNSLQNEFKQLGVEGKVASDKISSISSGIEAAVNSPQTKSGMDHFRDLIKNIGNIFKVALFDVPVGFVKETFRILGNQKPPPFIEDLQAELRSLNITIESTAAGIESATRPIAALDKVLGSLDSTFANTSGSLAYYQVLLEGLQPELDRVNVRLAQKRAAYVALVREGTDPASTSFNQLTAQIEILEGKSNDLTKQVVGLEKNIAAADVETRNFQSSTETFGGALSDVDTRLLSFNERTSILQETLRSLPPEITAVTDNFDVLAPTAERVNAIFDNLNTSLVDTQQELGLLDTATRLIIQDLEDLDGLAHVRAVIADRTDVHNANLIRPGVSDAVRSFRDYNDVLSETDVAYRSVADISQEVTGAIRNQASALSEVSRAAETAGIDISDALDRLDAEIEPVGREISNLELALQSLGDNSGDVLDSLIGQFSQLDGVAGNLGSKLGQFDIAGLASGNPNAIATLPFQLYDAFTFDQRQADALRPELDRQNRASFERGEFGIPPDLLAFGRGQLDTAASATGASGFGGRSLLELLEGLEPQIGRTTLDEVATIPDRIIETIQTFTDQILTGLRDELAQATFDLDFARQTGGDVEGALQDVIDANTTLYQTQIDAYNLQRQATGRAIGNVDELNRILNTLNNQARLQLADGPQNAQQFIAANNITRGLTAPTDDQERGVVFDAEVAAAAARDPAAASVADDVLANALRLTQDAIAAINTAIAGFDATIAQSNDPDEIASLLEQIAEQISEGFRLRREALQQQFNAGEITREALNTGIAQLNIEQSAAIEQNADAQLANALVINQQQIDAISVGISELESRIAQSNDPAEIQTLLSQIAEQIPEIYRLRRNALSVQYAAGEITLDAINTGIAALNIDESAAVEQNSDAQLANTLRINQQDVASINTQISGLENAISQSNDPAEIASLLIQIAEQIPEIYRLRREALQQQYDAGEITLDALNTGIAQLNIAESAAIEQNSDAQLANLFADHNADIQLIANTVDIVSEAIRNSNDPAEIVRLLVDLRAAIIEKYLLQREFLQAQLDAEEITVKQYQARIGRLNIQESTALGGADSLAQTQTQRIADTAQRAADAAQRAADEGAESGQRAADQAAQAAQRAADEALANALRANQDAQDTINVEITALENAISQSNDPAEIARLLMQIAVQIPGIYTLRKEALQTQFDAGKLTQQGLENGIAALGIKESATLEQNSDAQLANALRINEQATDAVATEIAALENAIAQSNDPAEIESLLQQIAEQIPEIYRLRRDALQAQYDAGEITLSALNTGIAQFNIDESAALEQNSDAQLANTLSSNQQAITTISVGVSALQNSISQSNDPAEIANLLIQIATQIPEIYRLRREALQAQYDAGEITLAALNTSISQLNIDESTALEQNSDAQLANALSQHNTDIENINTATGVLQDQIRNSDDPANIAQLTIDLRTAIEQKYALQRQILQAQLDAQEITIAQFEAQLGGLNVQEGQALSGADALAGAERDNLARTTNNLLQNAIQRAEFRLSGATSEQGFETRRQELITAIGEFYDAEEQRISQLSLSEAELQNLREDNTLARQLALGRVMTTENRFTTERIRAEETAQAEIERLRDEAIEREERRQQEIQDLQEHHNTRLLEIEERFQNDLDALRNRRTDTAEDLQTEYRRDLEDLRTRFARDLFGGDIISFSDLPAEQHRQLEGNRNFQRGLFDLNTEFQRDRQDLQTSFGILQPGSPGYDFFRGQLESGALTGPTEIENLFGRRGLDAFLDTEDRREDATSDFEKSSAEIQAEADAIGTAVAGKLNELLNTEQIPKTVETIVKSASEATTAAETAASHARVATENVATGIDTANMAAATLNESVQAIAAVAPDFVSAANVLAQTDFSDLVDAIEELPGRITGAFEGVLSERFVDPFLSAIRSLQVRTSDETGITRIAPILPVEQGGQELFHFESTDAIAHRMARSAAFRRPRPAPNYLPTPDQLRNARDVGREVVAGFTEGLGQQNSGLGNVGASQQPKQITVNNMLQLPNGVIKEIGKTTVILAEEDDFIGA